MQRCSTLGHRCTLTIPHPRITFSPISQKTCPVTKFSSALHTPPALLSHITPSARPILRPRACPRGRRAGSGPLTKAQSDSYMASVLGRAAAGHPIEGGRPPRLQRGARSHLLTAGPHTSSVGRAHTFSQPAPTPPAGGALWHTFCAPQPTKIKKLPPIRAAASTAQISFIFTAHHSICIFPLQRRSRYCRRLRFLR